MLLKHYNFSTLFNFSRCGGKLDYTQYLKLDRLLSCQHMLSVDKSQPSGIHDEHLFIITHQGGYLEGVPGYLDTEYQKMKNYRIVFFPLTYLFLNT